MTRRQEWRLLWTLMTGSGVFLCALPLLIPTARYPLVTFAAGILMLVISIWQRWRLRRHYRSYHTQFPLGPD